MNSTSSVIKPARTDTYEHTITGLLGRRVELFHEAERIRDRLAEIKNDISAMDRTLGTLGYTGPLDDAMPRQKRDVVFGQGELSGAIIAELRNAEEPMTSRDIARQVISIRGEDPRDRKYLSDVVKRVSKALRRMKIDRVVTSSPNVSGTLVWRHRSLTNRQ